MKKFVFLFLLAVAMFLAACSSSGAVLRQKEGVDCPEWAGYPSNALCDIREESETIGPAVINAKIVLGGYEKGQLLFEGGGIQAYAFGTLTVWLNGEEIGLVDPLAPGVEYILQRGEGEDAYLRIDQKPATAAVKVTVTFIRLAEK